ncbi:MAG: hypothetical protein ACK55I_26155, partial [bacterium]
MAPGRFSIALNNDQGNTVFVRTEQAACCTDGGSSLVTAGVGKSFSQEFFATAVEGLDVKPDFRLRFGNDTGDGNQM